MIPLAQFDFDLNEIMQALQKADLFDAEAQTRLLEAGAKHVSSAISDEAKKATYNLKFVSDKLKTNKVKKDKNGEYYITVTIRGKNERGERLAAVAFVLNYGRKKEYGLIRGSYFWTKAVKQAEDSIVPVYENEAEKIFHERGLS